MSVLILRLSIIYKIIIVLLISDITEIVKLNLTPANSINKITEILRLI
jgi:hypothetical protein